MAKLTYLPYPATDPKQLAFIRRTRTVCIYAADRPGIYSKNLVRIVAACAASGRRVEGVFCVDAVGSKIGHLIADTSHFKGFAEGAEIDIEILPATPDDCVEWLEGNEDPERKALAHILNVALEGAKAPGLYHWRPSGSLRRYLGARSPPGRRGWPIYYPPALFWWWYTVARPFAHFCNSFCTSKICGALPLRTN